MSRRDRDQVVETWWMVLGADLVYVGDVQGQRS
jgi:hypothetical protein